MAWEIRVAVPLNRPAHARSLYTSGWTPGEYDRSALLRG